MAEQDTDRIAQLALEAGVDLEALDRKQARLAQRVRVSEDEPYIPRVGEVVLSLDIQYEGEEAHVAGDLQRFGGAHIGTWAGVARANFPYLPGYFCFREGPPLLALVRRMEREGMPTPQVILIDGHGVAHPRRFGVACWMGLATGLPTVGCAKETLVHFDEHPEPARGRWSPVSWKGEVVGAVLRTQAHVKPVFVSAGHRLHQEAARALVMGLVAEYRVPEPLRRADHAARGHCAAKRDGTWTDLGGLDLPDELP